MSYYSSGLIFNAVCRAFDTTLTELLGPGKLRRNSDARMAAALLLHARGRVAPCDINRLMGKGYRWAYFACCTAKSRLTVDRKFLQGVQKAEAILAGVEVAA